MLTKYDVPWIPEKIISHSAADQTLEIAAQLYSQTNIRHLFYKFGHLLVVFTGCVYCLFMGKFKRDNKWMCTPLVCHFADCWSQVLIISTVTQILMSGGGSCLQESVRAQTCQAQVAESWGLFLLLAPALCNFIWFTKPPTQEIFLWIFLSKCNGQWKPFWLPALTSNWAKAWDVTQSLHI